MSLILEIMVVPTPTTMDPLEWAKFVIRNRSECDYQSAFSVLSAMRFRKSDAQFCLGLMYARGQGVPRDFKALKRGSKEPRTKSI